jgi:hypothetical protein
MRNLLPAVTEVRLIGILRFGIGALRDRDSLFCRHGFCVGRNRVGGQWRFFRNLFRKSRWRALRFDGLCHEIRRQRCVVYLWQSLLLRGEIGRERCVVKLEGGLLLGDEIRGKRSILNGTLRDIRRS